MKAAIISKYDKNLSSKIGLKNIPVPEITDNQVLVKVKAAAFNPLDIMNMTGEIKLIQNYKMPLVLGNELSGVVENVGKSVQKFKKGDKIYSRLPLNDIGAFAEYVAIDDSEISYMPNNLDFRHAAAVPLTGLTAYQALNDILHVKSGQTIFIPGGSGSFGQMAIPIAKSMGIKVIVSGSSRSKERAINAGADEFMDYNKENYWESLNKVDFVIDTLGSKEFEHEISVIKKGGGLLSLKTGPNKEFAQYMDMPKWKTLLFSLAGAKYNKIANKNGVKYRFIFVQSSGFELDRITKIVNKNNITPAVASSKFTLSRINDALDYLKNGHPDGKVIIDINDL